MEFSGWIFEGVPPGSIGQFRVSFKWDMVYTDLL